MYEACKDISYPSGGRAPFPEDESERFLFIDLRQGPGWAELESALPEGSTDDLTGTVV